MGEDPDVAPAHDRDAGVQRGLEARPSSVPCRRRFRRGPSSNRAYWQRLRRRRASDSSATPFAAISLNTSAFRRRRARWSRRRRGSRGASLRASRVRDDRPSAAPGGRTISFSSSSENVGAASPCASPAIVRVDLDPVGAVSDLVADDAHKRLAVGFLRSLRHAPLQRESLRAVTACRDDGAGR